MVFGKPSGQSFGAEVDLSALNSSNGFRLDGSENYAQAGRAVSAAGDINGDGFADLIVGALYGDGTGSAFVVFGGSTVGSGGSLDLTSLNGSNGFRRLTLRTMRGSARGSAPAAISTATVSTTSWSALFWQIPTPLMRARHS